MDERLTLSAESAEETPNTSETLLPDNGEFLDAVFGAEWPLRLETLDPFASGRD